MAADTVRGVGLSLDGLRTKEAGVVCQNTLHYKFASQDPQLGKSPFTVVANLPKYIPGQTLQGRRSRRIRQTSPEVFGLRIVQKKCL